MDILPSCAAKTIVSIKAAAPGYVSCRRIIFVEKIF